MDVSDDGSVLAIITNNGFTLVRPFPAAPERVNLLSNGNFAAGPWSVPPSPGRLAGGVVGGVLQFNNVPGSQNVVWQYLNHVFPVGAPLIARFRLGNSSTADKTITIGLWSAGGSSSSDLKTCTFVIPANSPLATYELVHRTTENWGGMVASVAADAVGSDGGSISSTTSPSSTTAR